MRFILAIDPGTIQLDESYMQRGKYGSKKVDGLTACQRYYQRHKGKRNAESHLYRENHKEQAAAKMREYRIKNPDVIRGCESRRVRPPGHKEKFNEYCKQWKKDNPDKRLASYQKRRSRIEGSIVSATELSNLRKSQNGLCFYCRSSLDNRGRGHLDHKTPLSKNGKHTIGNIVFACSACNLKKAQKTAKEFI